MQDTYQKRRKWMWVSFLMPIFFIIIGVSFSMVIAIMSSDCPIMIGDTVFSVPTVGGDSQQEASEYCKTMNYLGTDIGPKISFIGSAILIPAIFIGVILFFVSRRPKEKRVKQDN